MLSDVSTDRLVTEPELVALEELGDTGESCELSQEEQRAVSCINKSYRIPSHDGVKTHEKI